jgi:transposase
VNFSIHEYVSVVLNASAKERAYKLFGEPITQPVDRKVAWKPSRHDQKQVTAWPAEAALTGRLIAARVGRGKSKQWLYLFTTRELPAEEIVALYGERWNIETDLRSLKRTVHLQPLLSKTRR